ncbi:hypothetical protein HHK36_010056 [Tetracentron sinense]|uniref:Uncharacterized protein n=1 Tax=Tetracentron sinense TaxID=13715 RepID=A0A834ZMQ7_TETSI|nr:hypothetical protein HHK36_010056 [Tetracentron sinense]
MGFQSLISLCILSLISLSSVIFAQQPYARKATTACENTDNSTSVLGYTCNGLNKTCQSYLIFRSKPPYNTVSSISGLLAADPSQLSQINSVSESAIFETNKQVIVPVNCSCSGEYYQANASYVVEHENTYFIIANDTYQGLSTCHALQNQSNIATRNLFSGTRITVPLRCACPTKNQIDEGVNYLLSYTVDWGDFVSSVSLRFGVDTGRTLEANELSEVDSTIYPFTTLLIPLQNPPSNSQTISPPPPPPSPPPPSSPSDKSSNKNWVYIVIGVVAGGALLLVIGAAVFCIFFRKRKRKADPIIMSESFEGYEKTLNKKMEEESEEFLESISDIAQSLKVYKFQELKAATENFSPKCWIKGSVYRGTINGNFAAIKKMNGDVSKEINLLNKINHFNLIRLSGVCFSEGNWYLVYEYAVNGPLSDWIYYKEGGPKILSWTQRIQIALDVATGLNYLHCYTNPPHVHKDIRSSNVLLDSDFRAKIANFGLARSAEGQEGQFALTRHIIGTKGYMAPEYLENGLVSPKLDVYAFGILMLEILTGKEAAVLNGGEDVHLSEVLIVVHHEENAEEKLRDFIDPSLQGNYPLELALLMARLIESCLRRDPSSRLSMDEIVQSVSRILTTSQAWELSNNGSSSLIFFLVGNSVLDCNSNDETGPSPTFLYTCNVEKPSCPAFLIFKSQPPYCSVSNISELISSDPSELARINNVSMLTVFPTDQEVIVPVICSCSGQYYQANASYVILSNYNTYFTIANDTYQGLSTCDSLVQQNAYDVSSLLPGLELRVPLRCACPTCNQSENGTNNLLTYLVSWNDNVPDLSERFNVSRKSILDANGFSEQDPTLFPFTTILIPLPTEPSSSQTIIHYPPVTSPPYTSTPRNRRPKTGLYVGIGIATGCSLLVLCVVLPVAFLRHKKKRSEECPWNYGEGKRKQVLPGDLLVSIASFDQVLKVFGFEELKAATDNFSPKSRMKGSVYRGVFNGKVLAIKRMKTDASKEVNILNRINHFSLIKLHGACEEHGCSYLVYEYMENGSLRDWLHRKSCPEVQSWTRRVKIALDIANGLHYLHNFTYPAYMHRDIKSSSVLLDGNLRAKISNFSLARAEERGASGYASTRHVVGTRGYMAPEYLEAGSLTPKVDVYAFGIVMLELITGKYAIIMQDGGEVLLSAAIFSIMEGGNPEAELGYFMDPSLRGNYRMEPALRIAKLSVACLTRDLASRPSMEEVVSTLLRIQMDTQKSESLYVEVV